MDSTWESRDLPVLDAVVQACDRGAIVGPAGIAQVTGLDTEKIRLALRALASDDPPLFREFKTIANGDIHTVWEVTGEARRKVGAWPTPETLADRLIVALNDAADRAETEEERSRLRKAADAVGDLGKGVLASLIAAGMTGRI